MVVTTAAAFRHFLSNATEAEKDVAYERIAAASCEELAPFLHIVDDLGWTPLTHTVFFDNLRFFCLLVEKGADYKLRRASGMSILMYAAMNSTEILHYMLTKLGCDDIVNECTDNGLTALHFAVLNFAVLENRTRAVALLLLHGADPDSQYPSGTSALHCAASGGDTESAALLVRFGADLNVTDNDRNNFMAVAAVNGHAQFVQWLFQLGVGAENLMLAKDRLGRTSLDRAIDNQHQPVSVLLLQCYKNMMSAEKGDTSLHWILRAAIYKKKKIVLPIGTKLTVDHLLVLMTLFVSEQPNLFSTRDDTGALPLHIACQYPKTPIQLIQFLVDRDPSTVRLTDNEGNPHSVCFPTVTAQIKVPAR